MRHSVAYSRSDTGVTGRTCRLHRWSPGSPGGRLSVLFLHGMGAHTGFHANDLAVEIAAAGYEVVAPDLPGFGGTPARDRDGYAAAAMVDWLVELCSVTGLSRVVVVGHSWGGYLAVHLAADAPELVTAVVTLDGGHDDAPPVTYDDALATATQIDQEYSFATMEALIEADRPHFRRWSAALEEAYRDAMVLAGSRYVMRQRPEVAAAIRVSTAAVPVTPRHARLRANGQPVLCVLAGPSESTDDEAAERVHRTLPQAEVVRITDCSHFLPQDAGPELGRAIADWLSSTVMPRRLAVVASPTSKEGA